MTPGSTQNSDRISVLRGSDLTEVLARRGLFERRWTGLGEIGEVLAGVLVPAFADVAFFDILDLSNNWRRVFARAEDWQDDLTFQEVLGSAVNYNDPLPCLRDCLEGQRIIYPDSRADVPADRRSHSIATRLGLRAGLVVPVQCDSQVRGILALGVRGLERPEFTAADAASAERLASIFFALGEAAMLREMASPKASQARSAIQGSAVRSEAHIGGTAAAVTGVQPANAFSSRSEDQSVEMERLRMLAGFGAGLRHDLRNALMPIFLRLEVLALRLESLQSPRATAYSVAQDLAQLRESIDKITRLANGLKLIVADPFELSELDGITSLSQWWDEAGSVLRDALPRHCRFRVRFSRKVPAIGMSPVALTHLALAVMMNIGKDCRGVSGVSVRLFTAREPGTGRPRLLVTVRGVAGEAPAVIMPLVSPATGEPDEFASLQLFARRFRADVSARGASRNRLLFEFLLPEPRAQRGTARTARVLIRDARVRAVVSALLQQHGIDVASERSAVDSGHEGGAAPGSESADAAQVYIYDRVSLQGALETAPASARGEALHILVDDDVAALPEGVRGLPPGQLVRLPSLL